MKTRQVTWKLTVPITPIKRHTLVVSSSSVLVGSGPHCDVRVAPEFASSEELRLDYRESTVTATALGSHQCVLNGAAFASGTIPHSCSLALGSLLLEIDVTSTVDKPATTGVNVRLCAILALIAVATVKLLESDDAEGALPPPPEPPALWEGSAHPCEQRDPQSARSLAVDLRTLAEAKRERSPFRSQDGVAAVALFAKASSCFETGSDAQGRKATDEAASAMRSQVQRDFQLARLQLDRALSGEDWESARKVIRRLRSFVDGKAGDYVGWLNEVDRKLLLKQDTAKKPN